MPDTATISNVSGLSLYDRFTQGSNIRDFVGNATVAISGANEAHCGIARTEVGSTGFYPPPDLSTLPAGLWTREVCIKAGASFAFSDGRPPLYFDGAFDWNGSNEVTVSSVPGLLDGSEGFEQIENTVARIVTTLGTPAGASIAADIAASSGATMVITPILANSANPRYSTRDLPDVAAGSAPSESFVIVDGTGAAVDLSGKTLRFIVYTRDEKDTESVYDDSLTPAFKYESGSGITLGGVDNNQVTVTYNAADTVTPKAYQYFLWNVDDKIVLLQGKLSIVPSVLDV
jgi:hypothetical protein